MTPDRDRPLLSAIIVTWNSAGRHRRLLALAARSHRWTGGRGDRGGQRLERLHARGGPTVLPTANLIANDTNRGLAAANNQGMSRAQGHLLLIANPDVEFAPDAVEEMVQTMTRHDRCGWVVPRFVHEDGALQTSVGSLPGLPEVLGGRQWARLVARGDPNAGSGGTAGSMTPSSRWVEGSRRRMSSGGRPSTRSGPRTSASSSIGRVSTGPSVSIGMDGRSGSALLRQSSTSAAQAAARLPSAPCCPNTAACTVYFADRRSLPWRPVLAAAFAVRAAVKLAATALGLPLYSWARRGRGTTAPFPRRKAPQAPSRD